MKKATATFRDVGSFIAGILAGLAIGVLVFAMMDAFPDEWQRWPVFGASFILALGIALQVVATYKPRLRVGHFALLHTRIARRWRDIPLDDALRSHAALSSHTSALALRRPHLQRSK